MKVSVIKELLDSNGYGPDSRFTLRAKLVDKKIEDFNIDYKLSRSRDIRLLAQSLNGMADMIDQENGVGTAVAK